MKEEKPQLNTEEVPNEEELSSVMERIKESAQTEKPVGPGLSASALKLRAKNRIKNKLARKTRRTQRKRK